MRIPFIFNRKNIALSLFCILCCILLTLAISGCGDDYSSSYENNDLSNTGSYVCSLKWPEDVPTLESTSAVSRGIDCDAAGIATVAFEFYDGSGNYLTGNEWDCSLHQGTVYGIPAGYNKRLEVIGKDASGTLLYMGEQTGIIIIAGQTTHGGEIAMAPVTAPSAPTNVTATAGNEQVTISWDGVSAATSYNIYWATYSGVSKADYEGVFSDATSPYTHTGLTNGTSYYYVVTAENSYGESDESSELSVTPIAIDTNTSPAATITSPSDGSTYTQGHTSTFSGTGEDAEDGTLTGSSLVWTSSIDGEIGTGTSFTYADLSVGTNTITLTATDSGGATGTDSVSITIVTGTTFKLIPAGAFTMGSPTDELGRDSDEAQHEVTLTKSFHIQTTEVTQGQWKAVMGSNPSGFSDCGDDCPVEMVSWDDVQEFIEKLNQMEGTDKYRLPTEAEWEYACRAGSTTAFANGDITETGCGYDPNLDQMGWYCGNFDDKTHPVAQKDSNDWGLYDMHGNVWEWCQDWHGGYPTGPVTDPTGPSSGDYRVGRGGCWLNYARDCRSADRYGSYPDLRHVGFRLARDS